MRKQKFIDQLSCKISEKMRFFFKWLMIWGSKCHQNNSLVVCDSYVKYEEAEVDRLVAILKINDCGGFHLQSGSCLVEKLCCYN